MLAKCANPLCSSSFHYLEEGKLFRLENDPLLHSPEMKNAEYFWLCPACSGMMTLRLKGDASVRIVPFRDPIQGSTHPVDFFPLDRKQGVLLSCLQFLTQGKTKLTTPVKKVACAK